MTVRPGRPWGTEASGPPDLEVTGGDRTLATALGRDVVDPLVRFAAARGSDLARAVGLVAGAAPSGMALPLDALDVVVDEGDAVIAVSSLVAGVAPDRLRGWHRPVGLTVEIDGVTVEAGKATSLVLMNGQYLRGLDLSPRGHPGDGVAEAQLYALPPSARKAMRMRLPTGSHLPHPAIIIRKARHVVVGAPRPVPLEIDGTSSGRFTTLSITLRAAAYRLLV